MRTVIPSFESKTLSGNPFDSSQYWGHPVVVSFFAPQCSACEQTLRATQAVYSDVHDVTMIGVFDGDAPTAAQLATRYDLKFPVVVDTNKEIAHRFEVNAMPKTFVADNQGRLVWVGGANLTEEGLASAVETVR
jgi:peroxiredoxin